MSSTDDNVGKNGTQKPVEVFSWENTSTEDKVVQLAINRCFGEVMAGGCNDEADPNALPRIKVILLQNGGGVSATEYPKSSGGDVVGPSIFGHAASASAISVGAVRYNDDSAPEPYSSRGPATHYFGPVAGASAASPLPVPEVLAKPDVVATDCGRTTFFFPNPKTPEIFRFCGTSAAAPHAAAVAALALQANPTLTPAEIAARLRATARPVGAFGPNAVGAGLVDAARMVEGVGLPPRVSVTERPPPLTRNRRPSFGFASSRPVSFTCSIDGGAPFACSSPFVPAQPLADGAHVFLVTGTDSRGRGASAPSVGFTVDATPPRTFFRIHPRRALRTPRGRVKAVFRFGSDDPAASFRCALDGARLAPCSARVARRVRPGHHRMRAVAVDVAGNVDATPAVFRFRVERARRRSAR